MTKSEIQGEITACKSLLADNDYTIIKTLEGLLSCTSITDFVALIQGVAEDVLALKDRRQEWRNKINEMEALLGTIEGTEEGDA